VRAWDGVEETIKEIKESITAFPKKIRASKDVSTSTEETPQHAPINAMLSLRENADPKVSVASPGQERAC
jgi:hypothetical protein